MENPESERAPAGEEGTSLNRNRSFKSKQLVRSQAIRESQSPPRTLTPLADNADNADRVVDNTDRVVDNTDRVADNAASVVDTADNVADDASDDRVIADDGDKRRCVEIQITGGAWEAGGGGGSGSNGGGGGGSPERARARRGAARDLLSNSPRVACVSGGRHCRDCRGGPRRRQPCPSKQDSGISCSDDCPDCSDSEQPADRLAGGSSNDVRKASSLDSDDHSYCRCPDRKEKPKNLSLSRTDSDERSEPSGPELVSFIKETLNKNARDRATLLKIEKELHALVNDTGRCIVKFPVMTSYGRMLVHRCAALFQLQHHLDMASRTAVTVSKSGTSGGRIPCTSFKQWCTVNFPPSPVRHQDNVNAKSILKRDAHSPEGGGGSARAVERSKSLEQREKDYERVRRRIFSTDNCSVDEAQWPWCRPVKVLTSESRNKLLKVQSLEAAVPAGAGAVAAGGSWRARGAVSKSHSFGGYGAPHDHHHHQHQQHQPHQPRLLSRQGDLASSSWRVSPSSSGYKTLSLRSTDSVTPSPTGGASPEPCAEGAVVWAVTDLSCVPPGALVIHPQTGRPLTNADGSVYHFDPANPPVLYDYSQEQKIQNCDKRRGRLEKQHSFIDAEAECRCEESRSKCCCECRRHEVCHRPADDKQRENTNQSEQKSMPVPSSPLKNRYEQTAEAPAAPESTNHRPPYEPPANQSAPEPTNQRPEVAVHHTKPFEQNQRGYSSRGEYSPQYSPAPAPRPASYEPAPPLPAAQNHPPAAAQHHPAAAPAPHHPATAGKHDEYAPPPQTFGKGYRNDEMTSPPQMLPSQQPALQPELAAVYGVLPPGKMAPAPLQEHMRPVSLTNMLYSAPVPQTYPAAYMNQVRMEPPLQPLYQPVLPEEAKLTQSPLAAETTFRIDPSYPYAPAQYAPACAACAAAPDGAHQRSYNVQYNQMEPSVLQQHYPLGNVLLQHNLQHYPVNYQDQMQWGSSVPVPMQVGPVGTMGPVGTVGPVAPAKLLMHELCPVYPQYPYVYPQVIQQPYPIVQPMYPIMEKERRNSFRQSKRNSLTNSSRNTPHTDDKYDRPDRNTGNTGNADRSRQNSEIEMKIQQIKEQMASINVQKEEKRGNGLLGNAPNSYNGRVGRAGGEEAPLSSAARAIVNSLRTMHGQNHYAPEYRRQYSEHRDTRRRDEPRAPLAVRQMSPGNWYRRSPGPVHPVFNHPRRPHPHPDNRNPRR